MSVHVNGKKIVRVYVGNKKIKEIYKGSQLVYKAALPLPTVKTLPSSYTETQVATITGPSSTIYTVPSDGFYRVEVAGSVGGAAYKGSEGIGGKTSQIVFLYKGTKCLLWGSKNNGATGYPAETNALGGRGGYLASGQGGGGGGGAGQPGNTVYSSGGGGSGFLAGINEEVMSVNHKEGAWSETLNSQRDWSVGSFSVSNLYCYILGGGGGGACSDEGGNRRSGGGGGAFGNGGDTTDVPGSTGPGGTWGKGGNGGRWEQSPGGSGTWCILDFSRNQWSWGLGGSAKGVLGYCTMWRLNPN